MGKEPHHSSMFQHTAYGGDSCQDRGYCSPFSSWKQTEQPLSRSGHSQVEYAYIYHQVCGSVIHSPEYNKPNCRGRSCRLHPYRESNIVSCPLYPLEHSYLVYDHHQESADVYMGGRACFWYVSSLAPDGERCVLMVTWFPYSQLRYLRILRDVIQDSASIQPHAEKHSSVIYSSSAFARR